VSGAWRPILSGPPAEEAIAVAREICTRVRDPELLAAPVETAWPQLAAWVPMTVANGHGGLALLFAQLDACTPDEGWSDEAHAQLATAVRALQAERNAATGLFSGLAGLALAAALLDEQRYSRLLGTLDGLLARRTKRLVAALEGRTGCNESELDAISGLAGIGAYFLTRGDRAALEPVLGRLVELVRADRSPPAWHTPYAELHELARERHTDGYLNCGLSHGLPGPLSLLALALAEGVEVAGQRDAVRIASTWLVDHALEDEWGVNWPGVVPLDPHEPPRPTRAAWCYGAPGVASALWLAGSAVGNDAWREVAVDAMEAVFRRPPSERLVDAPTFCHGYAGLLHVAQRLANHSGSESLRAHAAELAARLVDAFEPDSRFGYRELDPDGAPVDMAELLQGAAGTALVLLATAAPAEPRWDRLFLLA